MSQANLPSRRGPLWDECCKAPRWDSELGLERLVVSANQFISRAGDPPAFSCLNMDNLSGILAELGGPSCVVIVEATFGPEKKALYWLREFFLEWEGRLFGGEGETTREAVEQTMRRNAKDSQLECDGARMCWTVKKPYAPEEVASLGLDRIVACERHILAHESLVGSTLPAPANKPGSRL